MSNNQRSKIENSRNDRQTNVWIRRARNVNGLVLTTHHLLLLLPWMEKLVAIGFARAGLLAAGCAALGAASAKTLAREPRIERGCAARNGLGQASAATMGWRAVQGPSQQGLQVGLPAFAALTIRRWSGRMHLRSRVGRDIHCWSFAKPMFHAMKRNPMANIVAVLMIAPLFSNSRSRPVGCRIRPFDPMHASIHGSFRSSGKVPRP